MKRKDKPRLAPKIDRCGPTGKVRYRSEGSAMKSLAERRREAENGQHRRHERRAYRCWQCDGWHLTAQAKHTS